MINCGFEIICINYMYLIYVLSFIILMCRFDIVFLAPPPANTIMMFHVYAYDTSFQELLDRIMFLSVFDVVKKKILCRAESHGPNR